MSPRLPSARTGSLLTHLLGHPFCDWASRQRVRRMMVMAMVMASLHCYSCISGLHSFSNCFPFHHSCLPALHFIPSRSWTQLGVCACPSARTRANIPNTARISYPYLHSNLKQSSFQANSKSDQDCYKAATSIPKSVVMSPPLPSTYRERRVQLKHRPFRRQKCLSQRLHCRVSPFPLCCAPT